VACPSCLVAVAGVDGLGQTADAGTVSRSTAWMFFAGGLALGAMGVQMYHESKSKFRSPARVTRDPKRHYRRRRR